jgi:DNA gyrase inhibitor GyrI
VTALGPVHRQTTHDIVRELEAWVRDNRPLPKPEPLRVSQDELAIHAAEQECIAMITRSNRAYGDKHLGEVK